MKKGFYLIDNHITVRCYYLTGEKKGNKWISIAEIDDQELRYFPDAEWWSLNWMCLPKEEELVDAQYFETNPTDYKL